MTRSAIPTGWSSAPRLKLPRYAAIYTLVSPDIQATEDEVVRRIKSGETQMSPAFDYATSVTRYYRDCPARRQSDRNRPSMAECH
jgi:hypothetical protein